MDQHKSEITFNNLPSIGAEKALERGLYAVAHEEGYTLGTLIYNFVPREKIVEINTQYLDHHYSTDIITFDYVEGKQVNGEIYICPEEVYDNAAHYGVSDQKELQRVIVHGLLHLCGYADHTDAEQQIMTSMENKYLTVLEKMDDGEV